MEIQAELLLSAGTHIRQMSLDLNLQNLNFNAIINIMRILKFKTNINCSGCVAAITPALQGLRGIEKWDVDIDNPDKVLTIQADQRLIPKEIISA